MFRFLVGILYLMILGTILLYVAQLTGSGESVAVVAVGVIVTNTIAYMDGLEG